MAARNHDHERGVRQPSFGVRPFRTERRSPAEARSMAGAAWPREFWHASTRSSDTGEHRASCISSTTGSSMISLWRPPTSPPWRGPCERPRGAGSILALVRMEAATACGRWGAIPIARCGARPRLGRLGASPRNPSCGAISCKGKQPRRPRSSPGPVRSRRVRRHGRPGPAQAAAGPLLPRPLPAACRG